MRQHLVFLTSRTGNKNKFFFCRYDNQLLVEYNVQCEEDQVAGYSITALDIEGPNCDAGNETFV